MATIMVGMAFFVVAFIVPFVFSCLSTLFFRFLAHKIGILDKPNGGLKTHKKPVAYLGGVAIFFATTVSYLLLRPFFPQTSFMIISPYYFLGLVALLVIGLIDDIFTISPFQKLVGQCIACIFFLQAGLYFKEPFLVLFLPKIFCFPESLFFMGVGLSLWWMLSIINAINLIDIMDGLATVVSFVALVGMALCSGAIDQGILLVPFLGVLVGFFLYNKPQASIYLGDAGSLVLGGILATTPFILGWGTTVHLGKIIAPFIILMIPIGEMCWLIGIRTRLNIPFYYGSPHHFALYFKRWGWSIENILRITGLGGIFFIALARFVAF